MFGETGEEIMSAVDGKFVDCSFSLMVLMVMVGVFLLLEFNVCNEF